MQSQIKEPLIAILSLVLLVAFGGYVLIWPKSIQKEALERQARGGWNGWLLKYTRSKWFVVELRIGGVVCLLVAALIVRMFMETLN